MTTQRYSSPTAFKNALDSRLRNAAFKSGTLLDRHKQLLVFDRFLARVVATLEHLVTLKGGLALELRLERARTTKDIDLRLVGPPGDLLARFQAIGQLDLGDFMTFEVSPNPDHAEIEALNYEGLRFRVECRLAGKLYGNPFGLDVAFGDPMIAEPETVVADDVLEFIGVPPPRVRLYPVETHLAEKLHAFTHPRPSSRVKDLPDIPLLASAGPLDAGRLLAALEQTFAFRATHAVPATMPVPPDTWQTSYAKMARDNGLPWTNLAEVTEAAQRFLNPVLAGGLDATWDPTTWQWIPKHIG